MATTEILSRLRSLMKDTALCGRELAAYVVYTSDAHQSEQTAFHDQRRTYITKFTGSAGVAVVTPAEALIWTDGRYHIQAQNEIDENWTLMKHGLPGVPDMRSWLCSNVSEGSFVGTDPLLVARDEWENLSTILKKSGKTLVPIERNLVDIVWKEFGKEEIPQSKIYRLEDKYTGVSAKSKISEVQATLKEKGADALFLNCLDSVAWLFNLRGADISNTPVFKSYAFIFQDKVDLFLHVAGDFEDIYALLSHEGLTKSDLKILPYFEAVNFAGDVASKVKKIIVSTDVPYAISAKFETSQLMIEQCPVYLAKSMKNPVEIQGIKDACIRDSAALCHFFAFLEDNVHSGTFTEVSVAEKLLEIRRGMENFMDLSFSTISSSGPNCAINHYNAFNSKEPVLLDPNQMYLCDSGAQYKDGTTDITRTFHFSKPTPFEIEAYTCVLKAHIGLAVAIFPEGVKGHCLDVLAREPLWERGLDYLHGTGHGIGAFLCVHEGPQRISHHALTDYGLMEGMLISNEPGYYEEGKFGIRLENMIFVAKANTKYKFNDAKYCRFETVSFVPFYKKLIDVSLLTPVELEWLNKYHQECFEKVSPILTAKGWTRALAWLQECTAPLKL